MEITQNTLSRDWEVRHEGKNYYVNCTYSDGQTLALLNRDNWEINDEDGEALNIYTFGDSTPEQKAEADENSRLFDNLVDFCVEHWDEFLNEVKDEITNVLSNVR